MKPDTKSKFAARLIGLASTAALAGFVLIFARHGGALAGSEELFQASQTRLSNLSSVLEPDDVRRGSLLFRVADTDDLRLAPLVATEVSFEVGGIIARGTIRQTFANPTDQWLEGIYVFPLPGKCCRRQPHHAGRRPDHRRPHQGAGRSPGNLRSRKIRGNESSPSGERAAQRVHILGGQHLTGRQHHRLLPVATEAPLRPRGIPVAFSVGRGAQVPPRQP